MQTRPNGLPAPPAEIGEGRAGRFEALTGPDPVNPNVFGSLGTPTGNVSSTGFAEYENDGFGLARSLYDRALAPGSHLASEDRQNIQQGVQVGLATQAEYARAESERAAERALIARELEAATPELVNRNAAYAKGNLDQQVANTNAFRDDFNQRRDQTQAAQGRVADQYTGRTQGVLADNTRSRNVLEDTLTGLNQRQNNNRNLVAGNRDEQDAALGGIQRGYGFRTDDIDNTMRGVDASMSRRQGILENRQNDLQARQGQNTASRTAEQNQLDSGYQNRENDIMSLLAKRGREASSDIERGALRQRNQSTSDLASRGIFNTTVTDSTRRGIEEDRVRNQDNLDERLTEQEIGLLTQLSGDRLQNQRQTSDTRNQLTQQTIGQIDQNLVRQQQAHMDTANRQAQTAQARSGLLGDALQNRTATVGQRNQMTDTLSALNQGNLQRTAAAEGNVAQNYSDTAALRSALTGDQLQARGQGVQYRGDYDRAVAPMLRQMLGQQGTMSEAQRATDAALFSDRTNRDIGFQLDEHNRPGRPDFIQLMNLFNQAGSDSPVPIVNGGKAGTHQPL